MNFDRNDMHRVIVACCLMLLLAIVAAAGQQGRADEFWVSDRVNNRVIALDAENGSFLRVIANTGMAQPTSLAEGPDGLIYVANGSLGDPEAPVSPVVVVDPNGALGSNVTNFNVGIASTGEAPLFPGGILYDSDSNSLLVSELGQFNGSRVFRFAMTGGDPIQTIGEGSAGTGRTGMTLLGGELYVSSFNDYTFPPPLAGFPIGGVLKSTPNGLVPFAFGAGQSATLLLGASGLDFKGDGSTLYVASTIGQGLVQYTITGGAAGSPQAFGETIAYPSGMLVTDQGGRESLIATGLGNDNASDQIYGGLLFPGGIQRYDLTTGNKVSFLVGDFNVSPFPAPLNVADLVVNNADLAVWAAAAANSGAADANGDGDSDGEDFLAWQRNYGNQGVQGAFQPTAIVRHVESGDAAIIPEPATIASVWTSIALIACTRRRRTRA